MNADLPSFLVAVTAPLLALAIDLRFGEPSARWHPVVWMGNYLQTLTPWVAPPVSNASADSASGGKEPTYTPESASKDGFPQDATERGGDKGQAKARSGWADPQADRRCQEHARSAFLRGMLAWLLGAIGVTTLAWLVQHFILGLPFWIGVPLMALCLKPMLSWRMLRDEVRAVEDALAVSLDAGRARLRWLVSRDVTVLDEAGVRESAIETLAENLNDSVVAPLFWFALFGLPGAVLYRFANTADAMWGYPGERSVRHWQWAGKWAARADDVLNWIPARLTAALLMMCGSAHPVQAERMAGLGGQAGAPTASGSARPSDKALDDYRLHGEHAACGADDMPSQGRPGMSAGAIPRVRRWRILCREAGRTPSPNSGWPMSAMALCLGVSLGKPGVYRLNEVEPPPSAAHTMFALRHAARVAWLSGILGTLAAGAAALA